MQQHFQLVYSEVHRNLTGVCFILSRQNTFKGLIMTNFQDASVDPPPLPIFCVGSRDFLALAGLDSGSSRVSE